MPGQCQEIRKDTPYTQSDDEREAYGNEDGK
jgi:hypothetical protein